MPADATSVPVKMVQIKDLILSAATTNIRPTAIFMTLNNQGPATQLTAVTTPACGRTELHDHIREGDVMRMRQVPHIDIPAGSTVVLKPMGLHIMCYDPVLPQKPGDTFTLTLTFKDGHSQTETGQIVSFDQAIRAHAGH